MKKSVLLTALCVGIFSMATSSLNAQPRKLPERGVCAPHTYGPHFNHFRDCPGLCHKAGFDWPGHGAGDNFSKCLKKYPHADGWACLCTKHPEDV